MYHLSYISAQEVGATLCLTELFVRHLLSLANIFIQHDMTHLYSCGIFNYLCVFKNVKFHNPRSHLHLWDGVKYVFLCRFCP